MARRAKRASEQQPADGATPAAADETTLLLGAGQAPAATSPEPPVPPVQAVVEREGSDVSAIRAPDGPVAPSVPPVDEPPPVPTSLAPGCRHTVMRAGWSSKGAGKKPVRRCEECGYTVPRGEDGRPTVTW